ncbi:MAG: ATPase domain-containing protein [Candidatus Nezhaarchaeales archaeon]
MLAPTGIPGFDKIFGGLPKGSLVVLAGRPGTGKTIFSASYLYHGALKLGEPGLYVSLSEDEHQFYESMEKLGMDFKSLESMGKFRFLELPTLLRSSGEGFNRVLEEAEEIKAKRLVIDSLTALMQSLDKPAELRTFLHTIISKVMTAMKCTAILIEEIPIGEERLGYGVEEFVASALIRLDQDFRENRSIRIINVLKLRGGKLERKHALFTLEGGFKVFAYEPVRIIKSSEKYRPLPQPSKGFSTGMSYLDKLLGGYPRGSAILFELSTELEPLEIIPVLVNVLAEFMTRKRPVIVLPMIGLTLEQFKGLLEVYGFSEEEYGKLVRIFAYEEFAEKCKLPFVIPFERENMEEKVALMEEELRRETGRSPIILLNLDHIALARGSDQALQLINHGINLARAGESLLIIVAQRVFPELAKGVKALVDMHFKLERILDTPVLYGVKPPTPILEIDVDYSKGYPAAILTPIV